MTGRILIIGLVALSSAASATPDAPELAPNAQLCFELPDLPPTLWSMHTGNEDTPRATVRLPENYSTERAFPLFIWLGGGAGGNGKNPGKGPAIMEGRDFIFVGMPLFQEGLDRSTPANGLLITTDEDGETICNAFRALLEEVYAAVPNIDTANNVFAGFSNGAHSIAAIIDHGDHWLLDRMPNIFIVEGGLSLRGDQRLAGRKVLMMYGGAEDRSEDLVAAFQALYWRLVGSDADLKLEIMHDTGHAFPAEFYPVVRDWVREVVGLSQPQQAEEAG